jgi:hypothetical protein
MRADGPIDVGSPVMKEGQIVARYDAASGAHLWSVELGPEPSNWRSLRVAAAPDGGVVIAFTLPSGTSVDLGLGSIAAESASVAAIVRVRADGTAVWQRVN